MNESRRAFGKLFEREIAALQAKQQRVATPSIRDLIEKTQDRSFKTKLIELVAPLKASSPSGRYPTVAQVRKMLAANDNTAEEPQDYSALSAEYRRIFDRYVTEGSDIHAFLETLQNDARVDADALFHVSKALTGRALSKGGRKAIEKAIISKFADRTVSRLGRDAARIARPL